MLLFATLALASPRHELLTLDREGTDPLRTMVRWEPTLQSESPRPVIVWSHGVGGSHESYEPLIRAWVEAGYVVAQPTHDDSLLGLSRKQIKDMAKDPPTGIWRQRPLDVQRVLDALPKLANAVQGLPPIDPDRIGVGGHSFGAYTAMLVAGVGHDRLELGDPRPAAFVWISPAGIGGEAKGDGEGLVQATDFETVERPVLFLTGSEDRAGVREQGPEWRMTSWSALDAPATLWFVEGGQHNFGGISGRVLPKAGAADPDSVSWVAEGTVAFWDANLKGTPKGPWLEPTAAKASSNGRVRVEDKEPPPITDPPAPQPSAAPED